VARLDQTVEQVLAAARAEDALSRARAEPVALSELLRDCIRDVAAHHHFPEDTVRLELGTRDRVQGDPSELRLIFRNLIENAVKYSDAPAEVRVRVGEADDGRVEVEIADQGIGIPSGELRKIFQRFYRVGRDVQRTAAGLGLGLYIVRNLVRRQGGRVVARSDGWGHGSRFVVTLRGAA
jgi:signal transduction histidine kinase